MAVFVKKAVKLYSLNLVLGYFKSEDGVSNGENWQYKSLDKRLQEMGTGVDFKSPPCLETACHSSISF